MDSDSGEQSEGEPTTAAVMNWQRSEDISKDHLLFTPFKRLFQRSPQHQQISHLAPPCIGGPSGGPDVFSSKSFALQAQKKILSKIASKTVANMLIDDTSSEIFDELYKVTKEHTHNKKEAHKIMKDLIKVAIKIGILYRNNQFNQEEAAIVEKFRKKLNQTAMTIVSFYEVDYTFDRNVLSKLLHECKDLVHELVQRHLTPRTHGRINHVFNHFADVEFLSTLYSLDGNCRPSLKRMCEGINKLLDEKVL
ncbi:tumor necrosis factor alpha-induced protein 8-like protein 3 isoform X3 [Myotis daubentonii]|uniref:tumor necrosis factor alpha-induced protein 8-like protein 3 isoform X3 n=1 Tax=Myotis daubentonii TaxID=98922 RepID=UPI002872AFA7|nr:tumor necrosis factor alpha-induced protein 8-like protein 3 isoform X3 [Myotis daubentonii]